MKVLFHIDESVMWDLTIRNLNNFIKDIDEEFSITVVANGDAINGYIDEKLLDQMKILSKHVTFISCLNSMKKEHVEPSALPDFVKIVPSGVVEIAKLEEKGFHYIKP
ncbi:DsrE family protein [Athalassotoga saccharophila]|uniref:DsrE family protein n=1 Tax=Athalassotoga saccharophila TaxID=1441386 RepID=UPI00137A338E|nr:DsrE family protein [Athalassotoga saccharophila]BBJ27474.1 DsrE/DsrF-like protein [Athalassotoga saccharophila]